MPIPSCSCYGRSPLVGPLETHRNQALRQRPGCNSARKSKSPIGQQSTKRYCTVEHEQPPGHGECSDWTPKDAGAGWNDVGSEVGHRPWFCTRITCRACPLHAGVLTSQAPTQLHRRQFECVLSVFARSELSALPFLVSSATSFPDCWTRTTTLFCGRVRQAVNSGYSTSNTVLISHFPQPPRSPTINQRRPTRHSTDRTVPYNNSQTSADRGYCT